MGFAAGSVTFRRYSVIGEAPGQVEQELLDKLAEHLLQTGEYGAPEDMEYGWCGGRHVFDGQFSFEHNVFADTLLFALRIDTNRVPGEVKKAYQLMEEDAVAANNPSGFISKKQKADVKDVVRRKIDQDLKDGKYRNSKMVPILWDLAGQTLYTPASTSAQEKLLELFSRTFGLELEQQSAGSLAQRILSDVHRKRDYEDLRPTRFVTGPAGDAQFPDYPWTAKGASPKDFLGNEFLTWVWHEADSGAGQVPAEGLGQAAVLLDKVVDLDCAYGASGRDVLRGDGPTQMPEARDALKSGKLPRKVGMVLDAAGSQFQLTFGAESFFIGAAKLPDVEEAENPRVLFEERIGLLRDLCKALDGMYQSFLKVRTSSGWEGQVSTIRRWILSGGKKVAAA